MRVGERFWGLLGYSRGYLGGWGERKVLGGSWGEGKVIRR